MRDRFWSVLPLLTLMGCHRHSGAPDAASPAVSISLADERELEDAPGFSDDLLPGRLIAFGLPLPTVALERMAADDMKVYRVAAPMPRVMRYLEQHLEVHDADIHPLAAVIHRAIVRGVRVNLIVDVGVRDEGDRTMVTVWNRTPPPTPDASSRTLNDGLRAVGIDPATGQFAPEFNR